MSNAARDAAIDFARFSSEVGSSLYLTALLRDGFEQWPERLRQKYSGLSSWGGVETLKHRCLLRANLGRNAQVFLSARSATLMRIVGKMFANRCNRILLTDTCWPTYRKIMEQECSSSCTFVRLPIRQLCLDASCKQSVIEFICRRFAETNCDGLFLPAIDNLGIRLPVGEIVEAIKQRQELKFVAVDAAQAIGQLPLEFENCEVDFVIAGAHKWLRALHPMGIGFACNPNSQKNIQLKIDRWVSTAFLDDPLLGFSNELVSGRSCNFGETVQVAPLLTASGSILHSMPGVVQTDIAVRNRNLIVDAVNAAGWKIQEPVAAELRSKIALLQSPAAQSDIHIKQMLLSLGIAATVYRNRNIRISIPDDKVLRAEDCSRIIKSLRQSRLPELFAASACSR